MKKNSCFIVLFFVVFSFNLIFVGFSAAEDFTIRAEIPESDGAVFTVSKVEGKTWTKMNTTNLDFGELELNDDRIFLPTYYWAIDVSPNGSGNPDLDAQYTDTANPNGSLNDSTGLGKKGTISFSEVIDTDPQTVNIIDGMSLGEVNAYPELQEESYSDGWLRIVVGIATGDPELEEGNAEPFTALDAAGIYTGTLTLTATFD